MSDISIVESDDDNQKPICLIDIRLIEHGQIEFLQRVFNRSGIADSKTLSFAVKMMILCDILKWISGDEPSNDDLLTLVEDWNISSKIKDRVREMIQEGWNVDEPTIETPPLELTV